MKRILLLTSLLITNFLIAQHPSCNGSRYLTPQFTPDTTAGIMFGNSTSFAGNNTDLMLDFYEPAGDAAMNRPLIILAFGGSFIGGQREDMHSLAMYYSSLGYTAATIDYRLYDGPFFPMPDSIDMTDVVIKAVFDMKAAIRYFREDAATANLHKIDTNLIFAGGISAGAIVALHAGMLQPSDPIQTYIENIITANGGYTGNSSNNTQYGDEVAGVINYSGALKWANYIDANDPPVFSVHDDGDGTVPYATGEAQVFSFPIITMQGSFEVDAQATAVGVQSELITIPNSTGHVSYFGDQVGTDSILQRTTEFLYPLVCNSMPASIEVREISQLDIYPNPASNLVSIVCSDNDNEEIRILDISGRVVLKILAKGETTTIDISSLSQGNYLVELIKKTDRSIISRTKLIKQ